MKTRTKVGFALAAMCLLIMCLTDNEDTKPGEILEEEKHVWTPDKTPEDLTLITDSDVPIGTILYTTSDAFTWITLNDDATGYYERVNSDGFCSYAEINYKVINGTGTSGNETIKDIWNLKLVKLYETSTTPERYILINISESETSSGLLFYPHTQLDLFKLNTDGTLKRINNNYIEKVDYDNPYVLSSSVLLTFGARGSKYDYDIVGFDTGKYSSISKSGEVPQVIAIGRDQSFLFQKKEDNNDRLVVLAYNTVNKQVFFQGETTQGYGCIAK